MAEKRTRAKAQQGSEEVRTVIQTCVADREDVVVQPVQPALTDHAKDLVFGESEVQELSARHRAALSAGEPG